MKQAHLAFITVIGKDQVGIIARVSGVLADQKVNIIEISQTILDDIFTMSMRVDTSTSNLTIAELSEKMTRLGNDHGLQIHVQDEEIIKAMHRI